MIDHLIGNGFATSCKEIALRAGLGPNTISRIKNNHVKSVDIETVKKVCDAYEMLDFDYYIGISEYPSLTAKAAAKLDEDLKKTQKLLDRMEPTHGYDKAADDHPVPTLPSWADNLIEIMTKQIKENETLNRELRQSIASVNTLRDELATLIRELKK